MRKRAAAWACLPGELPGRLGDPGCGPGSELPPRRSRRCRRALGDRRPAGRGAAAAGVVPLWVAGSAALDMPAGRYRVFYTIDEQRRVIQINHVARLG